MKFNKWTLGLAAVGAVSMASAVRADEAKLSSVQTALSNTIISGYVSASENWQLTPGNGSTGGIASSPGGQIPLQSGKANGFSFDRCRSYGINAQVARQVEQTCQQILQAAHQQRLHDRTAPASTPTNDEALLRCLMAGFVDQLANTDGKTAAQFETEFFQTIRPSSLIKRFATPEEVASLVAYVASPLSSATTGAALRVDGGVVKSAF